jgi:hypothetical protein
MFVFHRSAVAVLVPIALLVAVVLLSGRAETPAANSAQLEAGRQATTVAQTGEPRVQGS